MRVRLVVGICGLLVLGAALGASARQPSRAARTAALVTALRTALPFPAADASGALPTDGSAASRWFVIWPDSTEHESPNPASLDNRPLPLADARSGQAGQDSPVVVVRANPLHPETQRVAADAMRDINAAVGAAERRAQAAYDSALAELRRGGSGGALATITLDDEGVAGERIDAELELVITLQQAQSFGIDSREMPVVTAGTGGAAWVVTVPAHVLMTGSGPEAREHFRAAETHVFGAAVQRPVLTRRTSGTGYDVTVALSAGLSAAARRAEVEAQSAEVGAGGAVRVSLRGNAELMRAVSENANWAALFAVP